MNDAERLACRKRKGKNNTRYCPEGRAREVEWKRKGLLKQ